MISFSKSNRANISQILQKNKRCNNLTLLAPWVSDVRVSLTHGVPHKPVSKVLIAVSFLYTAYPAAYIAAKLADSYSVLTLLEEIVSVAFLLMAALCLLRYKRAAERLSVGNG